MVQFCYLDLDVLCLHVRFRTFFFTSHKAYGPDYTLLGTTRPPADHQLQAQGASFYKLLLLVMTDGARLDFRVWHICP